MLPQTHIPIGRLKQAFNLNGQEVEMIISALWPHGVSPYALWEMEYRPHWQQDASLCNLYYGAKEISSFPVFDPLEHEFPRLDVYCGRITAFFKELSSVIFVADLMKGLNRIIESTYETNDNGLNNDIEYFLHGLTQIENMLNSRPFSWETVVSAEIFQKAVENKSLFVQPGTISFLSNMFINTMVLDKDSSIRCLLKCGYSLRQEVKHISRTIVELIAAEPAPHTQQAAGATFSADVLPPKEDAPATSSNFFIVVPRALWEGKTPPTVRDGLRKEGYADPVIAYVLLKWCKLNKTRIGKLLSDNPDEQDDSTHRRRAMKFLEEAEALTIIPA
jgi:hypothetical protein